jgi:O-antigen/teichoic acid export membrane protein
MIGNKGSYRQIIKATSLFGGVQIFNVIIAIIRSKLIAILLGPVGMGIAGLLNSTVGLISSVTNFGLSTSAVKNVAAASSTGDYQKVAIVVSVLRRLVWITGLLGTITVLVLSPWLSQIAFGNKVYTFPFMWISITLLLAQLSAGQLVVLQGTRQLQYLAKADIIGVILALLITIPLYYILGIKGIVPAILLSSIVTLLLSWYFANKIKIAAVKVSKSIVASEGGNMLKMGFMLSLSGLATAGMTYLVRIFINHVGGIEQVGLYNAGFAFINSYVGMIFMAMSTDYYPRLSGVAHNNDMAKTIINQQAEVAILLLAPIIMVFLVFIKWIVILLYSTKFIEVNGMIYWAALGMFFKAASWPVGFILLAKGATKIFFFSELAANLYFLILNLFFYKILGINGLGIAFMISYVFFLIQVFIIARLKYSFSFGNEFYMIFIIQFLIGLLCFGIIKFVVFPYNTIIGIFLISISMIYSFKEMNKRLDLKAILTDLRRKFATKK